MTSLLIFCFREDQFNQKLGGKVDLGGGHYVFPKAKPKGEDTGRGTQ